MTGRVLLVGGDVYASIDRTVDLLAEHGLSVVAQVPRDVALPAAQAMPTVDLIIVLKNSTADLGLWAIEESQRRSLPVWTIGDVSRTPLQIEGHSRHPTESFGALGPDPGPVPEEHDGIFYIPLWTGSGFVFKAVRTMTEAGAVIAVSMLAMIATLLVQQALQASGVRLGL